MASKIHLQRICQQCGKQFTARTTVTKNCSDACAKKAYKLKLRNTKIETSNSETQEIKKKVVDEIKLKEFLTVSEVAKLLNCSSRMVYYYINNKQIKAIRLSERITRIRRIDLDSLFE
jgi:excisionase family DNA binding protein